jgi:hypothetical protein
MDILKLLAICGSAAVLLLVIELIRRGRLKERYSLLWLLASGVLLVLSTTKGIEYISHLVGIYYPPSALFLVAFLFLLMITLHFSIVISGLSEKNKKLAQELALLKQEVAAMSQRGAAGDAGRRQHGN